MAGRERSRGQAQCYITDASFKSFSRVLVGCHRHYEQDNTWHACVVCSYPRTCLLLTGTDLVRFTWFAVEARRYLRINDPGLHNAKCTSPQQMRMHSCRWVYILRRVDTLHSHSLCGSVLNRGTVLVRRLCVPGTLLQHTIEVARTRTVAMLLDSVSYKLTRVTVKIHHRLRLITARQSPAYTKRSLEF